MRHPARVYHPHTSQLLHELMQRVESGLVKTNRDGDLAIFHYTQECQFTKQWDDITLMARGLIIDTTAHALVATPFPKFFNYGEHKGALPDEPFVVDEKLDGSLGIIFYYDGKWRITTKGAFENEQGRRAQAMLDALTKDSLMPGSTYLVEIVGPWNRIVVPYATSELVLLACYDPQGFEVHPDEVREIARRIGLRSPTRTEGKGLDDLLELAKTMPRDDEGFVVRFSSGLRIKIKGDAYVRAHKLASRVTPLGVWDAMLAGDDMQHLRAEVPEELWSDFDYLHGVFEAKVQATIDEQAALAEKYKDASLRDVGLAQEPNEWLIFAAKRGRDLRTDPKLRRTMFDRFRPTSNVLDGYVPSSALNRFSDG